MACPDIISAPQELHPSLWRASQLAHSLTRCVDTGHLALSSQLPGGGWPTGALTELLLPHSGSGEVRLLAPALAKVQRRRIVLLQPPHTPQVLGLAGLGLTPSQLVWVRTERVADSLWAAAQVLQGGCGALLFWAPPHMRGESLRRLQLAASAGETLFFMMRPRAAAQDSSPAPLRIGVRPVPNGVELSFLKRRGPQRDEPLFLPLAPTATVRPSVPHREHDPMPAASQAKPQSLVRSPESDPAIV